MGKRRHDQKLAMAFNELECGKRTIDSNMIEYELLQTCAISRMALLEPSCTRCCPIFIEQRLLTTFLAVHGECPICENKVDPVDYIYAKPITSKSDLWECPVTGQVINKEVVVIGPSHSIISIRAANESILEQNICPVTGITVNKAQCAIVSRIETSFKCSLTAYQFYVSFVGMPQNETDQLFKSYLRLVENSFNKQSKLHEPSSDFRRFTKKIEEQVIKIEEETSKELEIKDVPTKKFAFSTMGTFVEKAKEPEKKVLIYNSRRTDNSEASALTSTVASLVRDYKGEVDSRELEEELFRRVVKSRVSTLMSIKVATSEFQIGTLHVELYSSTAPRGVKAAMDQLIAGGFHASFIDDEKVVFANKNNSYSNAENIRGSRFKRVGTIGYTLIGNSIGNLFITTVPDANLEGIACTIGVVVSGEQVLDDLINVPRSNDGKFKVPIKIKGIIHRDPYEIEQNKLLGITKKEISDVERFFGSASIADLEYTNQGTD